MCGIVAILDAESRNTRQRTENALRLLRHRGPDGWGIWQSPDRCVSLGHSRLALQDISGGAQPLSNEDGTVFAVVNGEFYDFEPIRQQLTGFGHRFQTASDSEILIHLYEQFGFDCLKRLQGEFAFVLWDEHRRLLWAARDRFGVKPLYYAETRDGVLFASEVKGLKQAGLALAWDEEGFFEQFIFQTCLEGRTLYRGVSELPPGYFFTYQNRAARLQKYWDLYYPTQQEEAAERTRSEEQQAEALLKALDQAVQSRLRTERPAACYLSGGIDSTSICALVQRNAAYPVQAFSLRFEDPEYDEFPLAQQSAAALGIGITEVPVSEAILAGHFSQTVWHCESLVTNANAVAKFCLSRAVRETGFRIVLTGEGADELLAGYPNFTVDYLRHGSIVERRTLQQQLGKTEEEMQQILFPHGMPAAPELLSQLGYVPAWMEARYWTLREFGSVFGESQSNCALGDRLLRSLHRHGPLAGRCVLQRSLYIHSKTSLSGVTLQALGDRVEMAHSVEGRLPFLDHRVVDLVHRLPCSLKIRHGAEKYILRQAMRAVIPAEVCGRRKRALAAPPALAHPSSVFGELLQDTLRSASSASLPFLNRNALKTFLDRMPSLPPGLRQAWDGPLLSLASACVLSKLLVAA